jgi:hypothetical protein
MSLGAWTRRLIVRFAGSASILCAVSILCAWISPSYAQSAYSAESTVAAPLSVGPQLPPLDVPLNKLPARDPTAISVDGWLLYPTLRLYTLYSDNLFFSPVGALSLGGFGITPSMVAEWTNGIHTTTLYGNLDSQGYPGDNDVNTLDGRAGFTQKYEAMRDLIFTVNGEFNHKTWAPGLQSSIQTPGAAPSTTVLPNGNTVLPNGTIVSPSGQPVGQVGAGVGSAVPLSVNPYDQYMATFSVDKIFNRGFLNVSSSVDRIDYETDPSLSSRGKTLTETAGVWLGPLFYAYSNGSFGTVVLDETSVETTSYRLIGGLGTRQFGLFRGSIYFGHQASDGSTSAGGDVYGGTLLYYATPKWTIAGTIDRTLNVSSQISASTNNLALTFPGLTAIQIPVGTSTHITSTSLLTTYEIARQWFTSWQLGYTTVDYLDSSRRDASWVVDGQLRYDIWRNTSLTWEYLYKSVSSNAPFVSTNSNTATFGVTYRF